MATTRGILIWVSIVIFVCGLGIAQTTAVPPLVKYSGTITERSGTVGVTFALYAGKEGGAPLWLETQNVQTDTTGHYTVFLGASQREGLPLDIFSGGEARWLGVKPEGQVEQPRVLLVSVPYALKARDAETFAGLPSSSFVLAKPHEMASSAAIVTTSMIGSSPMTENDLYVAISDPLRTNNPGSNKLH